MNKLLTSLWQFFLTLLFINTAYSASDIGTTDEATQTALNRSGGSDVSCTHNVVVASPCFDFTFKELFSHEKVLKGFLNALYYPNATGHDMMIRHIEYLKAPFVEGSTASEKAGDKKALQKSIIFDRACRCYVRNDGVSGRSGKSGEEYIFDVEMQRKATSDYYSRATYYACNYYGRDLTAGDSYSRAIPVKVVSFLHETLDEKA
jgi:hypothetical protein